MPTPNATPIQKCVKLVQKILIAHIYIRAHIVLVFGASSIAMSLAAAIPIAAQAKLNVKVVVVQPVEGIQIAQASTINATVVLIASTIVENAILTRNAQVEIYAKDPSVFNAFSTLIVLAVKCAETNCVVVPKLLIVQIINYPYAIQ